MVLGCEVFHAPQYGMYGTEKRERMCLVKVRHESEGAARVAATRSREVVRWYECPVCRGWHLTRREA